jgi:hypothetical protein
MVMRISGSAQFIHTPSPWGTTPVPSDDIHARRGVASLLDANRAEQTIAVAELNSLETGGISWKIYATPDGNAGDNVLPYFKQYQSDANLAAKAFGPSFPAEFQADCATGKLPQVSWVLASLVDSEHPPAPVTWGEVAVAQMLNAITSNPSLWAKTAVFITYRGPLQSACALQAEGRRDDGPKPPDRGGARLQRLPQEAPASSQEASSEVRRRRPGRGHQAARAQRLRRAPPWGRLRGLRGLVSAKAACRSPWLIAALV